jgi:transposase-like protein
MNSNTAVNNELPKSLLEAVRYFADLDVCTEYVSKLRWPDGPICPRCDGKEHSYLTTRRLWKCKACKRQFSVKVGTIFEDSPIGLDKWLPAVWLLANSKNGVSSHELARAIGITQKSAWHVFHRIRHAMEVGTFELFDGEVETDETFVGGAGRFMHKDKKARVMQGRDGGWAHKTVVVGTVQRATDEKVSQVRAEVVAARTNDLLVGHVRNTVDAGAALYTDMHKAYNVLADEYDHATVDHLQTYVNGRVHTNGIENFWTLLKRGLKGTYVYADPKHLDRYVDERVFTYNERDRTDLERFDLVLCQGVGRRLTWAELTDH